MESNFEFLEKLRPSLADLCKTAEGNLYSDPNFCVRKLGCFAEAVVSDIISSEQIVCGETQSEKLCALKEHNILSAAALHALNRIRLSKYDAMQKNSRTSVSEAKRCLRDAFTVQVCYMRYYDSDFILPVFYMPEKDTVFSDFSSRQEEEPDKTGGSFLLYVVSSLLGISIVLNVILYLFGSF